MQSKADARGMNSRLIGLGVFLLVVGAGGYGGIRLAESRVSEVAQWPSVRGRIVTSEVSTAIVKTGRVRRASDYANIEYAYTVDGRRYECDRSRVIPMLHSKPEGEPEELVRRFPVGRSVNVYYDPSDPSDALLTNVPAEDARSLMRTLAFLAPCIGFVGLLLAIIGGNNLWIEHRAVRETLGEASMGRVAAAVVEPSLPANPVAAVPMPAIKPPVKQRTTHWLVRGTAVLMGLFLMLFGGPMSVTMARMSDARHGAAVKVVALMIVGGAALLGAFLIYIGMRKSSCGTNAAAAN